MFSLPSHIIHNDSIFSHIHMNSHTSTSSHTHKRHRVHFYDTNWIVEFTTLLLSDDFVVVVVICLFWVPFYVKKRTNSSYKHYSKITSFSLLSPIYECCVNDLPSSSSCSTLCNLQCLFVTDGVCLKWDWTHTHKKSEPNEEYEECILRAENVNEAKANRWGKLIKKYL